jgi:hypothetical protein
MVDQFSDSQSLLCEKVIQIKFLNPVAKEKALLKLKDCLYRQEANPDYIYAICRVNDQGAAENERLSNANQMK